MPHSHFESTVAHGDSLSSSWGRALRAQVSAAILEQSTRFWRHADFLNAVLRHSDSIDRSAWRRLQLRKVQAVFRHAVLHVPHWRQVANTVRLDPSWPATLRDAERFPVTTRADFKRISRADLLAEGTPPHRLVPAVTSGSTGEPLSFYQDARELPLRLVAVREELRHAGADPSLPVLIIGLGTHRYLSQLGDYFPALDDLEERSRRVGRLYATIQQKHPATLISTPSLLKQFVAHLASDGVLFRFKTIFYRGEALASDEREWITRALGGTVFSSYGTRECSMIAFQCEAGSSHTVPWLNYVEILGDNGEALPLGSEGRIVVTYFGNYVMPFLRYEIGDRGFLREDPCPCGRQAPRIEFRGRAPFSIILPSGRQIPALWINNTIAEHFSKDIAQFQLEQMHPGLLIFRFIPSRAANQSLREHLLRYWRDVVGNEVTVRLEAVSNFSLHASGKAHPVFGVEGT